MSGNKTGYITESKRLCKENGMDPMDGINLKKKMSDEKLQKKRQQYEEIISVIRYFSDQLLDSLKGTPILIAVTDSLGHILDISGDDSIISLAESLGIQQGVQFTQEEAGTNVISLALQQGQGRPVSLIGKDHYHTCLNEIACYGSAFTNKGDSDILGSISIMVPIAQQNPLLLSILLQVVESIGRELLLRKQNRQLNILNQIMINGSRNGIIITDENGKITECNEVAQKLFCPAGDWDSRSIQEMPIIGSVFRNVIENQHVYFNEDLLFRNPSSETVICLFDAQPIYESGRMIGVYGYFRNVTERHIMTEKIKETEKEALAGRIAAGIAHEVRNPLTTVRGYLQFLSQEADPKTADLFSNLLIPEIDIANKIITDFLSISKNTTKEMERVSINDLISYLWQFLKGEAILNGVEMTQEVAPESLEVEIRCNREELLQVFINLIRNSIQAKGNLPLAACLLAQVDGQYVKLSFRDTGKGIPDEIIGHIFEPFFTTKDHGTGLGLFVSRKIVESHNGTLAVTSDETGTTVEMVFPIETPIH